MEFKANVQEVLPYNRAVYGEYRIDETENWYGISFQLRFIL